MNKKIRINERQYNNVLSLIKEDMIGDFNHNDYEDKIMNYLSELAKPFNGYADIDEEKGRIVYYIRFDNFTIEFAMDDRNGSLYIERIITERVSNLGESVTMSKQIMMVIYNMIQRPFNV